MDLLVLDNAVYFVDLNYVLVMDYYTGYINNWDVLSFTVNYFIGLSLSGIHSDTGATLARNLKSARVHDFAPSHFHVLFLHASYTVEAACYWCSRLNHSSQWELLVGLAEHLCIAESLTCSTSSLTTSTL